MAHLSKIDEESDEILCPRCRADAKWRYLDEAKSLVEVICPDCGVFEIPRLEFEQEESDVVEPNEPA